MQVRLISITQSLIPEAKTAEEIVVYCARVSNPSNQANMETAPKLLKYCLEHGHYSIFEQVSFCVEIETSRAIAAQILRHRSFTFQEFSQRYADASQLGFEEVEARRQDPKNRQSSTDDLPEGTKYEFRYRMEEAQRRALGDYKWALSVGVAKEQARLLLPLNVTTRLYMTGNCRSWIHYLQARTDPATQKEHRQVAEAVQAIFVEQFPAISEALGWVK